MTAISGLALVAIVRPEGAPVPATLERVLRAACAGAWRAVEVVLSGEALRARLGDADPKVRSGVAAVLSVIGTEVAAKPEAVAALRAARRAGMLDGAIDMNALAASCGRAGDSPVVTAGRRRVRTLAISELQKSLAGDRALAAIVADTKLAALLVDGSRAIYRFMVRQDRELARWAVAPTGTTSREQALTVFAELATAAETIEALDRLIAPDEPREVVAASPVEPAAAAVALQASESSPPVPAERDTQPIPPPPVVRDIQVGLPKAAPVEHATPPAIVRDAELALSKAVAHATPPAIVRDAVLALPKAVEHATPPAIVRDAELALPKLATVEHVARPTSQPARAEVPHTPVDTSVETPRAVEPNLETPRVVETNVETPRAGEPNLETPRVVETNLETPRVVETNVEPKVETPRAVEPNLETSRASIEAKPAAQPTEPGVDADTREASSARMIIPIVIILAIAISAYALR